MSTTQSPLPDLSLLLLQGGTSTVLQIIYNVAPGLIYPLLLLLL